MHGPTIRVSATQEFETPYKGRSVYDCKSLHLYMTSKLTAFSLAVTTP